MQTLSRWIAPLAAALGLAGPVPACELAIVFAVDASGSIAEGDYATQIGGLAQGLRDPIVADALERGRSAALVLQWSGHGRQEVAIGWTRFTAPGSVAGFADQLAVTPRLWHGTPTALGEALAQSGALFASAPRCRRRVIDISGNGRSNEGPRPEMQRPGLQGTGVTVNAIVIDPADNTLGDYFRRNVILGRAAFALVAKSRADFAQTMRLKLFRELNIFMTGPPLTPGKAG